jgi:hypothetical protein
MAQVRRVAVVAGRCRARILHKLGAELNRHGDAPGRAFFTIVGCTSK